MTDFNAAERLLRDERDSWFQESREIQSAMRIAHAAGQVKRVRCLGAALAFAYASRDAADELLTEMMKLTP